MRVAHVVVDIPTRAIAEPFDYAIPDALDVRLGHAVLVDFGNRPVVGFVVGIAEASKVAEVKPVQAVLDGPYFGRESVQIARWIACEYAAPLAEAFRLVTPPGATPKAVRTADGWELRAPGAGAIDARWAQLTAEAEGFQPAKTATMQRAVLDALAAGPVRVAELGADLGSVSGALKRLEGLGVVSIESRRLMRGMDVRESAAPRHERLTEGQTAALDAISSRLSGDGGVVLLDGVTGSGKTEVYLRAIEQVRSRGGGAIVLVPEISLTPQTVGRFRSRFGDEIAVLHSRLSAGERYDQWDRARMGEASIVVGARSALFAPVADLQLVVIDEEHENSYKQGSSPRYHARAVAERLCELHRATLVLGSASPSMESLHRAENGPWLRVSMPERVNAKPLPEVTVVDMAAEFESGHRAMFSRELLAALDSAREAGDKAVLLLNRRGYASFLLCRECGFVPECESCSLSLTYHDVGNRLACHHCGATAPAPVECPRCSSPYLRKFGAGTQRVQSELEQLVPDMPVVRMDADTTSGKGGHERALMAFEAIEGPGILLGTQMIAKGLDYPDVTLVGVINADTALHLPDFRSAERTYQMLEQVAGRAGRGRRTGCVVVQTYWPHHPAIQAAARHDPEAFYAAERSQRSELGYPPYGRLANVLAWGTDARAVSDAARVIASEVEDRAPETWTVLGASPAPLARLKGVHRWHVLVKAPNDESMQDVLSLSVEATRRRNDVSVAIDIDPVDLL